MGLWRRGHFYARLGRLADVYGRWHGQGFGASYQFSRPFNTGVTLVRGDSVTVRHIMRVDTLRGIEQIGIKFRTEK